MTIPLVCEKRTSNGKDNRRSFLVVGGVVEDCSHGVVDRQRDGATVGTGCINGPLLRAVVRPSAEGDSGLGRGS